MDTTVLCKGSAFISKPFIHLYPHIFNLVSPSISPQSRPQPCLARLSQAHITSLSALKPIPVEFPARDLEEAD